MERREFLTKATAAGLASVAGGALMAQNQQPIERQPGERPAAYRTRVARTLAAQAAAGQIPQATVLEYYELRRYEIESDEQKVGLDKFLSEAMIPVANRLGVQTVGVFYPAEGLGPVYALLVHSSIGSFATLTHRLYGDREFLAKGADFVNAPADNPAYKNLEVQLLLAFTGMPTRKRPTDAPGRIFQLRTYESPSEKAGLKKIEMFNNAEIAIFRKVGLHPVFFGRTLAGAKMPNLTYMLGFKDMAESQAKWVACRVDPEWQKLKAMPEFADGAILRKGGITNLYLKPASYSQI